MGNNTFLIYTTQKATDIQISGFGRIVLLISGSGWILNIAIWYIPSNGHLIYSVIDFKKHLYFCS